eukprot:gene4270-4690_t
MPDWITCSKLDQWAKSIAKDSLRGGELKNLLLQQLHVDPALVSQTLDRAELRRMAESRLAEIKRLKCSWTSDLFLVYEHVVLWPFLVPLAVVALLLLLASNKRIRKSLLKIEVLPHALRAKLRLFARLCRRCLPWPALLSMLSITVEVLLVFLHLSVLVNFLSFLTPPSWNLRQYLFLGPDLSITTALFKKQGWDSSGAHYGINLGPMLLSYALNMLIRLVDDQIAKAVLIS